MPDKTTVFTRIDEAIEPFRDYRKALDDLRALPPGYAMCFSFHYVDADILNGGVSQLYGNSTWALVIDAISAAENANARNVGRVLKEIVYYYHKKGRSKLKRRIDDNFFDEIPDDWDKSLEQLDGEYFDLGPEIEKVIPALCNKHKELFNDI